MTIFSISGVLYVAAIFALSFLFGYFYRLVLKKFRSKTISYRANKNIGTPDRLARLVIGIVLLVVGLRSWSPIALFFSGFAFYEAIANWCGVYAVFGRNTCSIK